MRRVILELPVCSAVIVRAYYDQTSSYVEVSYPVNVVFDSVASTLAMNDYDA